MRTLLFESQLLRIGAFRCPVGHPEFEDSGPIRAHLIVFPRTSVSITHAGGEPIVADPNVVMFYNRNQCYRRDKLSEQGDRCEWFEFPPYVVRDAIAAYDPTVADRADRLFTFAYGPSVPDCYLWQRLVVEQLGQATAPDTLFVEETLLAVLSRVLTTAYRAWGARSRRSAAEPSRAAVELTQAVKQLLAASFRERLTLGQIARHVYISPYHLCRTFRAQTGLTIHQYLNQLRLRTALEYVAQADTNLAALGVELGYASHSHFTQAFHLTFGVVPSAVRRGASVRRLQELSKNLIA